MKKAGCKCVSFGVETGTNQVLKASRKNLTVEQITEAMETVSKVHFDKTEVFLIIGLPGETTDTIDQTVDFLKTIRPLFGQAWQTRELIGQLPLIFPGTELEGIGRKEGCLPENFSWNQPYLQPKRHLPLVDRRNQTVPHFETRSLPLEEICTHLRRRHWDELSRGQKRHCWENVLVKNPDTDHLEFIYLDNDRTRKHRRVPAWGRLKNLVQIRFVEILEKHPPSNWEEFWAGYRSADPEVQLRELYWKNRVERKSLQRAKKWLAKKNRAQRIRH